MEKKNMKKVISQYKKRTPIACEPCRKGKLGCEHARPCSKCLHRGIEHLCIDRSQIQQELIEIVEEIQMMKSPADEQNLGKDLLINNEQDQESADQFNDESNLIQKDTIPSADITNELSMRQPNEFFGNSFGLEYEQEFQIQDYRESEYAVEISHDRMHLFDFFSNGQNISKQEIKKNNPNEEMQKHFNDDALNN
jgi:hypothetical protein